MDPRVRLALMFGGGAAALALLSARRQVGAGAMNLFGKAVTAGKELAFAAALPPGPRTYGAEILRAAEKYGVSPWLVAGVMYRESTGGLSLRPPGPRGTGDFLARYPGTTYFKYANPATGLPPDGLGWGRGLMQIDYGAHNAWVTTNDWGDPQTNIDYAARELAGHQRYFAQAPGGQVTIDSWRIISGYSAGGKLLVAPWSKWGVSPNVKTAPDPRPLRGTLLGEATLAAYNGGRGGVLQAVAVGLRPAKATSGGDYADWVMSRVTTWLNAFPG